MIRKCRPLAFSVSDSHGPVIQKAALPLRKASLASLYATFELIRPSRFHLSINEVLRRNVGLAIPSFLGLRTPLFDDAKMYPHRPEKNGYMWYASPPVPCGTEMAMRSPPLRLNARASLSSCANVFGTFTSDVLTTRPTFSSATGMP